jgi:hypothetical protein
MSADTVPANTAALETLYAEIRTLHQLNSDLNEQLRDARQEIARLQMEVVQYESRTPTYTYVPTTTKIDGGSDGA